MPWRLLKFGLTREHPEPRMFITRGALKGAHDVVIIGGGGHGLAAAYYLARDHGIRNVAGPRFTVWSDPGYSTYFHSQLRAIATDMGGGGIQS
jgi:NADPH-dependent 2,4-dienoyl-CoA reductase/sulfur reductase-like enzyme